jgi:hypothetical protein
VWNRTHVAKATAVTPFEAIRGKKPNIRYLGVFGCDVYCHVPKNQRYGNTFKPKMQPGIYVGHDDDLMAAVVYLLEDGKTVYTRDVDLRETSFKHARAVGSGSKSAVDDICSEKYEPVSPSSDSPAESADAASDDQPYGVAEDGTEVWLVEEILNKRLIGRGKNRPVEYLVKWQGYPRSEATWEPERNLDGSHQAIADYEDRVKARTRHGRGTESSGQQRQADEDGDRHDSAESADNEPDWESEPIAQDATQMVATAVSRRPRL